MTHVIDLKTMICDHGRTPSLTGADVERWRALNDECWDLRAWHERAGDGRHFSIYEEVTPGPDFKLLYDSYLWKLVIAELGCLPPFGRILELLPGESRTIPLALESLQYKGQLDRLDVVPILSDRLNVSFPARWIDADMVVAKPLGGDYRLILGNHVLDDLLAYLHFPDAVRQRHIYSDQWLAKQAWATISASENLAESQAEIARTFIAWMASMRPGAVLLLRQYPATCALRTANVSRINTDLETFSIVADALRDLPCCRVELLELDHFQVPMGSKFPQSFLAAWRM